MHQLSCPPTLRLAAAAALFALSAAASAAAGLGFLLDDSAVRNFNAEDGRLMSAALEAVLSAEAPTTTQSWRNSATGSHGTVTGIKAFTQDGLECRRVKVENEAGRVAGSSVADLCEKAGEWRLLGFPAPAGGRRP